MCMTRSVTGRAAVLSVAVVLGAFASAFFPAWSQPGSAQQRVSLGVAIVSAADCQETRGACIAGIRAGSAAERAGLQQGDVITRIGKVDLAGPETLIDAM